MQLDHLERNDVSPFEPSGALNSEILDELAYLALAGHTGIVPQEKRPGMFQVGSIVVNYAWSKDGLNTDRVILRNQDIALAVTNAQVEKLHDNTSVNDLLELWNYVQYHSDGMLFLPPDHRREWIRATSKRYKVSEKFVQNLAANYPQIRRLFS